MESHTETMFVHQVHALDDRNERFLKRHVIFKEGLGGDSRFKFVLLGDNTPLADELDINDQVTVTFHIEGREWISPQEKQVIFTDMVIDKMINLTNATLNITAKIIPENDTLSWSLLSMLIVDPGQVNAIVDGSVSQGIVDQYTE